MDKTTRRIMVDVIAYDEAADRIIEDGYRLARESGIPAEEAKLLGLQNAAVLKAMRCLLFEETNQTGGQNYE